MPATTSKDELTVSVKLTQKQAGKLYMEYMARGERIKALRDSLKRIVVLADAAGNFEIGIAARAALEPPQPETEVKKA